MKGPPEVWDLVHRDDYEFLRLIAREYYRVAGEARDGIGT
jgi:hypothetical protein